MRERWAVSIIALLMATGVAAQPDCPLPGPGETCLEGAIGDGTPQAFAALSAAEVDAIVHAAADSLPDNMTVAVVDRAGRVLALFRKGTSAALDDQAVGVARTAAFFSHNMAPLSSRTVRFISGVHFPPGLTNAPNAALYGIENTNRGCDFNVTFNAGKCVPRARTVTNADPCGSASGTTGCGAGIVTGKQLPDDGPYPQRLDNRPINAGGIPLYRLPASGVDRDRGRVSGGKLVGGIGVVGIDDPQRAEYAAVTGAFGALVPLPSYPLPQPGNVFIDGIRLPFLGPDQRLRFDGDGIPIGLQPLVPNPAFAIGLGTYAIGPLDGGCAANGYLVGPSGGATLASAEVDEIVQRATRTAKRTRGIIRLPLNSYARMVIAVADANGEILAIYRMPDATVFSIDVAVAKARNVVYFSGSSVDLPGVPAGTAVTNRTLGFGSQPLFPPGIDSRIFDVGEGPFYSTLFRRDLANPCTQGSQAPSASQNGIVFFPGATPLYRNNVLVGGLGISGDGVEQDDYVSVLAAGPFLPAQQTWADRIKIGGVRLPMFKFPRQPEGVKECGGKPCG